MLDLIITWQKEKTDNKLFSALQMCTIVPHPVRSTLSYQDGQPKTSILKMAPILWNGLFAESLDARPSRDLIPSHSSPLNKKNGDMTVEEKVIINRREKTARGTLKGPDWTGHERSEGGQAPREEEKREGAKEGTWEPGDQKDHVAKMAGKIEESEKLWGGKGKLRAGEVQGVGGVRSTERAITL